MSIALNIEMYDIRDIASIEDRKKGLIAMDVTERAYGSSDLEFDRCLFDALVRLMEHTPLDRIAVVDITMEAHVSRASFYRRYRDKYDLLNRSYELILHDTLLLCEQGTSWKDSIRMIYDVIGRNALFFRAAFASNDRNSLKSYIFERTLRLESGILQTAGVDTSTDDVQYRLRAYVAGGLQLTVDWVQVDSSMPLDELVDILVEMVPEPFRPYFI